MNTDHVQELLQLSESLSINKTAARLYMTQSCLSRHVASMEKELGVTVFIRTPTGLELTESGRILIESLKTARRIVEHALESIRRREAEGSGPWRVSGCLGNDRVSSLVAEAVSKLSSAGSLPALRFQDIATRDYRDRLVQRQCDLVIAPCYGNARSPGLIFVPLLEVPLSVVCDRRHPLASKDALALADLDGCRLIAHPAEDSLDYRSFLDGIARRTVPHLRVDHQTEAGLPLIGDCRADMLFGMLGPHLARQSSGFVVKGVVDAPAFEIYLVRRNEPLDAMGDRIVQAIREAAESARELEGSAACR